MLMVVFGAGASFDIRPRKSPASASDAVLPLAMHLFDHAYGQFAIRYPACQPLLKRLRAAASNVEPPGKEVPTGYIERANQLIDMVGRYQRTGRYCMGGQDLTGWGPLRPAIAVPMVTKTGDDFACPGDHIRRLQQAIPDVSHLLVVGWRGAEGHFHERWRQSATTKTVLHKAYVVDATEKAAAAVDSTLTRDMAIGGGVRWDWAIEGFSRYVESSAVKGFLGS